MNNKTMHFNLIRTIVFFMSLTLSLLSGTVMLQWSNIQEFDEQFCSNVTDFSICGYTFPACANAYAQTENDTIKLYHPSIEYIFAGYSRSSMYDWINNLENKESFTCYVNHENNEGITEIYPYGYWWLLLFIISTLGCCCSILVHRKQEQYEIIPPRYELIDNQA